MPLTVQTQVEDQFAIVELSGNLTLGPALGQLREQMRQLLSTTKLSGVILRVGGVTQTDSSGLGELTAVYTMAARRGCPIRLVEASASLRKMLAVTRLDGLLPSASDVAGAKAEMKQL